MNSDLAEQIQTAGELDDKTYQKMVQINNDFQKALMTPITSPKTFLHFLSKWTARDASGGALLSVENTRIK